MPKSQLDIKSLGFDWSLGIGHWSLQLQQAGFLRVERDDRLFDVFPHFTREHGVEVWEKWMPNTVELISIRFQNPRSQPEHLFLSRQKLEAQLMAYQRA